MSDENITMKESDFNELAEAIALMGSFQSAIRDIDRKKIILGVSAAPLQKAVDKFCEQIRDKVQVLMGKKVPIDKATSTLFDYLQNFPEVSAILSGIGMDTYEGRDRIVVYVTKLSVAKLNDAIAPQWCGFPVAVKKMGRPVAKPAVLSKKGRKQS